MPCCTCIEGSRSAETLLVFCYCVVLVRLYELFTEAQRSQPLPVRVVVHSTACTCRRRLLGCRCGYHLLVLAYRSLKDCRNSLPVHNPRHNTAQQYICIPVIPYVAVIVHQQYEGTSTSTFVHNCMFTSTSVYYLAHVVLLYKRDCPWLLEYNVPGTP